MSAAAHTEERGAPPPLYRNYPIVVLFAAVLVLSALLLTILFGHLRVHWPPVEAAVAVGGVSSIVAAALPPAVLARPGLGRVLLFLWSLTVTASVGAVVAGTGGRQSPFWVIFILTAIFFSISFSSLGQAGLVVITGATYVVACLAAGGLPPWTTLLWRLAIVFAAYGLASVPVFELRREAVALDRAREAANRLTETVTTQEAWWRGLIERTSDPIVVLDADRRVTFASPSFEALLGHSGYASELARLVHPDDLEKLRGALVKVDEVGGTTQVVARLRRADGSWRVLEVSYTALHDLSGAKLVANLHDVTERVEAEATLTHEATHDSLTNLANRVAFYETLRTCVSNTRRTGLPLSVLVLDLEGFKEVNDTVGHAVGDEILVEVARRISHTLRGADVVARLGGDEFAAILATGGDPDGATVAARRVLEAINETLVLGGRPYWLRASVGVSCTALHGLEAEQLVQRADRAMYEAKRIGIGVALYDDAMDTSPLVAPGLLGQLQRAIASDELRLCFQPKVSLTTGQIVGAEALVRWEHPRLGLLGPGTFLPLAEASGLVRDITAWVIPTALRELCGWRSGGRDLSVAVNLSARDLADPTFSAQIADWLAAAAVPAGALTLELTEASAIADRDLGTSSLTELRSRGIRTSLDDFGSGYSSLAYLSELPLDEMKLDRGFLTGHHGTDGFVLRSVIDIGHHLGLTVVAEGVETPRDLARLGSLGVDVAQGHLFAEPMFVDEFLTLLGTWPGASAPASLTRILRRMPVAAETG
jgi:diguanylate cyclase (GGDEF)-like protein/PAS domain S-box-containing protein